MPGLVGFLNHATADEAAILLENMARALHYKQHFQVDLHHEQGLGLGRVSSGVINSEPQPIWNKDRSRCILFEGEIYGYDALKEKLQDRGYQFLVNNDAEFILHLFAEFGEQFVCYLNGAFIAAIWDRPSQTLTLVNDRFGLRPLYYSVHNRSLLFGSGVRSLLADPTLPRKIDRQAISEFMTFEYMLGDKTLVENINLMPPASLLTFQQGEIKLQTYWKLQFVNEYEHKTKEQYLEETYFHLQQAVARQSQGAHPKGLLLSGGLDSRMILAMLSLFTKGENLYTFTFGAPGADDVQLAEELAKISGTRHHTYDLKEDYLIERAEEGVYLTDGMESCAHMHVLANLRSQAELVKVIYKGYLGDALMGGHIGRELWANYSKDQLAHLLFMQTCSLFRPIEYQSLFTSDFSDVMELPYRNFRATLAESGTTLAADCQNYFDLRQRQRRFILHGVELARSQVIVRTPFCDNDLVSYMLTVPPGLRLERLLVTEIFGKKFNKLAKVPYASTGLPLISCMRDSFIRFERQVKWQLKNLGLSGVPIRKKRSYANYAQWMRTVLRSWIEANLLHNDSLTRGYFQSEFIHNLVSEHMAGADHHRKLGALLSLELWHRKFID